MLILRLQRTGKKNAASFRLVVAEKTSHVSKKVHEVVGVYNARLKTFSLKNPDRVQYWIAQRIQLSPTVHNLLIDNGLLKSEKIRAFKIKKSKNAETGASKEPGSAASNMQPELTAKAQSEITTQAQSETTVDKTEDAAKDSNAAAAA